MGVVVDWAIGVCPAKEKCPYQFHLLLFLTEGEKVRINGMHGTTETECMERLKRNETFESIRFHRDENCGNSTVIFS